MPAAKDSASYGAHLHSFWLRASTEAPFTVACGPGEAGRKVATNMRYRLYCLRTALKNEGHELYPKISNLMLQLVTENSAYAVRVTRADAAFDTILASSGVEPPEAPPLPDLET